MDDQNFHPELSHQLVGVAMKVHTAYGSIHKEVIYERAFKEKLLLAKIPFLSQPKIPVLSVDTKEQLGWYQPDFLIADAIIVELKSTGYPLKVHETQLRDYLKCSRYELGYVLNFGMPSLYYKRIVFSNGRK